MFPSSCFNAGRTARRAAGLFVGFTMLFQTSDCPGAAQKARCQTGRATAALRSKNVESFEVVWKTIRDKHFDPKLGGLDWQAVHDTLRPKVEAATTMKDARDLISDAIARLHQTHFAYPIGPLQGPRESRRGTRRGRARRPFVGGVAPSPRL